MATQSGGSAQPDATAVPLADGGADDHTEKICQTSGPPGIYGMIFARRTFVQNREILRLLPHIYKCTVFYAKDGSCYGFAVLYAAVAHVSFFDRTY